MIETDPRAMVPEGFAMAMRGSLAFAPYDAPHHSGPATAEWLILCRWGEEGEYLSIARAGPAGDPGEAEAPIGLRPQATFLGLRMAGEGHQFLLLRHCPPGLSLAGVFHPSDGIARLAGPAGALRLEAAGRYAHLRGRRGGEEVRADVPDPPEGSPEATAWNLQATRIRWLGEFLAGQASAD
ncbi:hypothetical protein JMJ55_01220 [Belnapia sp. T6]|uniref:Uncharacterized protein n=1 Tax=Belnapia mucosa TaxID=2804532 RepID=A0ABS1UY54_9PROT|nr:hypothetical protein [Belnapia mucosa]MBL6453922.1 hypothetical protein [Belnapia mucosa]